MILNYDFTLLLLIFLRMSGCVLFNPILGSQSIPISVRTGISIVLTLFTYPIVPKQNLAINSATVFIICGLKELFIGFLVGFIIQLFLSVIVMAGEMTDMQVGVAMSRVYNPQSDVSMPLSAMVINAMFLLMFFATNSHLTLIRIFTELCSVVPYGDRMISPNIFQSVVKLLGLMLIYAVKMSLPMVAVQFISEIGVGLLTRAVPQIDIFSIQIEIKLILGILSMLILVPPYASFLERLITLMFDSVGDICRLLI